MNFYRKVPKLSGAFAVMFLALSLHAYAQTPVLASWNDGPAKQAIVSFVKEVTDNTGAKYVEPKVRIATFDQDGTLWVEHPLYNQATFALARVHDLAPEHSEWKQRDPFKAVLANDLAAMAKFSESDWEAILGATHAGMTTEAFQALVKNLALQVVGSNPHYVRREEIPAAVVEKVWFDCNVTTPWTVAAATSPAPVPSVVVALPPAASVPVPAKPVIEMLSPCA